MRKITKGFQITDLQNEYAVLLLPENIVQAVAALEEIEYMEKPKSLFFAVGSGAACASYHAAADGGGKRAGKRTGGRRRAKNR